MTRADLIRRGNIITTEYFAGSTVGRYLGNGRFGAILSETGLNLSPAQENSKKNRSFFNHMIHWGRFRFFSKHVQQNTSADYILPLFRVFWEEEWSEIRNYSQLHEMYDGVLTTVFRADKAQCVQVINWFDGEQRDMACIMIDIAAEADFEKKIRLEALEKIIPFAYVCTDERNQSVQFRAYGGGWKMSVVCEDTVNDSRTDVYIRSSMEVQVCRTGLSFTAKPGRNYLYVSIGTPVPGVSAEDSLERTKKAWHRAWESIGWLDYQDDEVQKVWVRSMAYLMSSYDADCEYIQPANSMGLNGFPYNFVPDMENAAPAMQLLGRNDIVMHWVEILAGEIEGMRAYTRRLWPEAEGVFPPWELNFGPVEGYHYPHVPVIYCYESHNAGYLSRLAMEAAEYSGDKAWAEKYAYPIIRECAVFFRKFCFKEADGLWHLTWYPCMGRDEAGGVNKDDYLCTLITAKYSFRAAIRCGLDEDGAFQKILDEGLAFESLLSERGTYHTCRGADDFGKQKHPVQLEGIACFPTESGPLPAEVQAYRLRHDITDGAKTPWFLGWTLAQLLIADTNMKEPGQWAYDWSLLLPSKNTDDNWVQFYESSGAVRSAFYLVTHAMILQSLVRNCVNDYWGSLDIAACLPEDASVRFGNIRTRLGVTVSGQVENGKAAGSIVAWRDCTFRMGEETLNMKKGETKEFCLMVR